MFKVWFAMVFGDMPTRAAMVALPKPAAMRPSTSRSRGVSEGNAGSLAPGAER